MRGSAGLRLGCARLRLGSADLRVGCAAVGGGLVRIALLLRLSSKVLLDLRILLGSELVDRLVVRLVGPLDRAFALLPGALLALTLGAGQLARLVCLSGRRLGALLPVRCQPAGLLALGRGACAVVDDGGAARLGLRFGRAVLRLLRSRSGRASLEL